MQHPPMARVDRDAGMTAGVTGKRDEHDPGCDLIELLRRGKAAPCLAVRVVLDVVLHPLLAAVPQLNRPDASLRVGAVVDSEAGVDENQTVIGFDQQHVTDADVTPSL